MAISAYTDQGQLKKNPLLGTSLNVDRKQRKMKRAFGTLYGEAREGAGTGSTQRDLTNRLTDRNNAASAINLNRLRDLSNQNDSVGANRRNLRDRGAEQGFANFQKGYGALDAPTAAAYKDEWAARSGGRMEEDRRYNAPRNADGSIKFNRNMNRDRSNNAFMWRHAGGTKLEGNKDTGGKLDLSGTTQAAVLEQIRSGRGFDASAFGGGLGGYKLATTNDKGRKFHNMRKTAQYQIMKGLGLDTADEKARENFGKWANQLNRYNKEAYAMDKYGEKYGADKKRAYNRQRDEKGGLYDRQQARIQQEAPEVQQRMQDRADLYNMFAGG